MLTVSLGELRSVEPPGSESGRGAGLERLTGLGLGDSQGGQGRRGAGSRALKSGPSRGRGALQKSRVRKVSESV